MSTVYYMHYVVYIYRTGASIKGGGFIAPPDFDRIKGAAGQLWPHFYLPPPPVLGTFDAPCGAYDYSKVDTPRHPLAWLPAKT